MFSNLLLVCHAHLQQHVWFFFTGSEIFVTTFHNHSDRDFDNWWPFNMKEGCKCWCFTVYGSNQLWAFCSAWMWECCLVSVCLFVYLYLRHRKLLPIRVDNSDPDTSMAWLTCSCDQILGQDLHPILSGSIRLATVRTKDIGLNGILV